MANHDPAYYDSQASAAAALNVDIYLLREAKSEGCPAFRSGRVYREPLLEWLGKHKPRAFRNERMTHDPFAPAQTGDARIDRISDVGRAIIALTNCVNRGLITSPRYLEIGTELVRSITDEMMDWPEAQPLIKEWTEKLCQFLFTEFDDLKAGSEAHPALVGWLCRVAGIAGVEYGGKKHRLE